MWRMPVDLDASKRDADLVAYYDNEVRSRAQRRLPPQRVAHRAGFIELVKGEGRGSILEIGSGPGRDGQAFANAGLAYTGVDLSPRSVAECRSLGLEAVVASVLQLPFRNASFDAGWTMSTLLHIGDAHLDVASRRSSACSAGCACGHRTVGGSDQPRTDVGRRSRFRASAVLQHPNRRRCP